eukprot:TRINITY_DN87748_c0_g1_i1.p1 TRINITY_DN87748_c0_g1~~TRINITY_DN87748_c0_g1_i1.p1  ORF type:complete len:543 (+),score=59.98 TRINITY_DN87748_c0_g1_i1:76-1704(+)
MSQSTQKGLLCGVCSVERLPDCDIVNLRDADAWFQQADPEEPSSSTLQVEPIQPARRADTQPALSSTATDPDKLGSGRVDFSELCDPRLSIHNSYLSERQSSDFFGMISRARLTQPSQSSKNGEKGIFYRAALLIAEVPVFCCLSKQQRITYIECSLWGSFQCFIFIVLALAAGLIVYVVLHGNHIGDSVSTADMTPWVGSPDKLTDFYRGKCVSLVSKAGSIQKQIETYNWEHGFKKLNFTSRGPSAVRAEAFYLPSPSVSRIGPRVVLVHGMKDSEVASSVQVAGYMLRKLNVSAMILNLRAVEAEQNPASREVRAKPLDFLKLSRVVLGAWDYAVQDPEGLLGGSIAPDDVGLMGFEFGGFVAQHALAAEPRIAALLLDGILHNLEAFVKASATEPGRGFITLETLISQQAVSRCEANLRKHIENFSTPRFLDHSSSVKIGLVRSSEDTLIPGSEQRELLLDSLKLSPGRPSVLLDWTYNYGGPVGEACTERREIHLSAPREYFAQTCTYWSAVLNESLGSASPSLCQSVGELVAAEFT